MRLITLEQAEKIVKTNERSKRSDKLTWDGWTLVHRKPHGGAFMRHDGVWNNGWFVETRYELNEQGQYELPDNLCVWRDRA